MKTLGIVVIILALGGLGWYYFYNADSEYRMPSTSPSPSPSPSPAPVPQGGGGFQTIIVEMTPSGFSPAEARIKAGDTVRFINKDSRRRWPASGVHPTHQICPGFDAIGGVDPNGTYSFKFTEKKECPIHDHLNPTLRGKIIVE